MRSMRLHTPGLLAGFSLLALFPAAHAQERETADEYITAHGQSTGLQARPAIGGKLGLSIQHNPASISIIDQKVIAQRGYTHAEEAADSAPGVTSGGSPGNPAQLMMRGFSGNQVLVLRDGFYFGPTTMVNRPLNAFNLEAVEILKGPSSVLYGQGAVGGTVDMRLRVPDTEHVRANALVSYGSFNSWNAGFGGSIPLSPSLAIRSDFSRTSSDGYVKGADPHSNDWTTTLLWHPGTRFSARLSMDYLIDELSTYYGAPLVPGTAVGDAAHGLLHSTQNLVISRASLWRNYNVANPRASSVNATPTLHLDWAVTDHLSFHDKAYLLYAKRRWDNAETYSYIAQPGETDASGGSIAPGRIGRDRFYVYQNQHQVGDSLDTQFDHPIFGMKNRFVLGGDAYYLRFIRNRGFPDASYADSVSLTDPQGGSLGSFTGEYPYRKSPTTMLDAGIFLEDSLSVTRKMRLVGGFRYDWLSLDRQNYNQNGQFNPTTSFKGHYHPSNFRIGPVYDLTSTVSLYGVYTTAEDPPGSNLFLANKGQFTRLSQSRQGEIGIKASTLSGHLVTTLALFDIRRSHVLVQTGQDSVSTAGVQKSRGIEGQADWHIDRHWSLSGNVAYTDARYGTFFPDAKTNATGNRVPNVPAVTANLWAVWSSMLDLPLDLGAGMRYVSSRKGDYANTLTLNPYALVNVFADWHIRKGFTLYGRIDNLANRHFVQWADTSYPSEVLIGAPRSFSISMQAGF